MRATVASHSCASFSYSARPLMSATIVAASLRVPRLTRSARAVRRLAATRLGSLAGQIPLERGKRGRRELVRRQPLPVPLPHAGPEPPGLALGIDQQPPLVDPDHAPGLDDDASVDQHLVDVVGGPALDQRL